MIITLLIVSVLALSLTLSARVAVESNNKVVDVVLDYSEFRDMAAQSEKPLTWWLEKFESLGVQYVGLQEENLESLMIKNNQLQILMGWQLLQEAEWRNLYPSEVEYYIDHEGISEFDVFIATKSQEVYDFISNGLKSRYTSDKFQILSEEGYYTILLKGNIRDALYRNNFKLEDAEGKLSIPRHKPYSSKLLQVGLGFDTDKINVIRESGLEVLPRPFTYIDWMTEEYMEATFADIEAYDMKPPVFLFSGGAVLGYPNIEIIANYMIENNIAAGLIETSVQRSHIEQEGLNLLTRSLNYDAVRIFSVWPYIQERFGYYNYEGAEEIENTLYRAVTERNIRFIFFKPFKVDDYNTRYDQFIYVTDYEEYEKMFERFEARIAQHGMTLGDSSRMEPIRVRIAKQTLMGWGIVAASILFLTYLIKLDKKYKYGLLAMGLLMVPAGFVVRPMLMDKLMALWAAVIFPSLSMVYFCHRCFKYIYKEDQKDKLHKKMIYAARDLIIVSAISLVGGLFVAGILSHIEYLLEMDIFRGVKISQMIPMIIYPAIFMAYFGYRRNVDKKHQPSIGLEDIKTFLFEDIKIVYVLLSAVFLGVLYIYLARTGHETNIQPSTFELIARNILEEKLLARPRTAEFLIAFPALMVGIYFAKARIKSLTFVAGLVAVIGQASIANTFSHLRTPVYLSTVRTLYALVLGVVVGIIYILILEIAIKLINKLKTEIAQHKSN